jgi:hypothetical protein
MGYKEVLNQALKETKVRSQCLTSIILPTWEAEIGRIVVGGQPGQIVCENPSPKQPDQNGVRCGSSSRASALQMQSPEFKQTNKRA